MCIRIYVLIDWFMYSCVYVWILYVYVFVHCCTHMRCSLPWLRYYHKSSWTLRDYRAIWRCVHLRTRASTRRHATAWSGCAMCWYYWCCCVVMWSVEWCCCVVVLCCGVIYYSGCVVQWCDCIQRWTTACYGFCIISNRKNSNWASQILKANMLPICPYCLKFQIARV